MLRQEEFIATFLRERIAFENPNSRTAICVVRDEHGEEQTVKGDVAEGALSRDMPYRFFGRWSNHWKHGRQFVFSTFVADEPATQEAIVAYLRRCPGIGPATAYCLWEEFGNDAVRTLRESPGAACVTIPRFTGKMARKAAEYLRRFASTEKAKIELIGLLDGRGFPKKIVDLALEKWGNRAAETIKRNPYRLLTFRGCGFLGTDKMWCDLGLPVDRLKRQALCAWYALANDSEGHTVYPIDFARKSIMEKVTGHADARAIERSLELSIRSKLLATYEDNGSTWIADGPTARSEERLAGYLADALVTTTTAWPTGIPHGLSDHQFVRLRKALRGPISLLTGSPGTGKTYVAAALINAIMREYGTCVAACAPTGKAAIRLTQSLQEQGVDLEATTIHRLLKVESAGDGGFDFVHGEDEPLPNRFVIVDESSMIDTSLMASLLAARATDTGFLFLGDTNQLAPVGRGAPLRDMITAGLPCGELREIRRNSGQIVEQCAQIRDWQRFDVADKFDVNFGENLMLLPIRSAARKIDAVEKFLDRVKSLGFDPIWDVQILCAVNRKSELARKPLNDRLQGLLNPTGKQIGSNPFRMADKVINLKNGWFPALDKSDSQANADGNIFAANGELAEVVAVEPARTIVRLPTPERIVVVPHGQPGDDETDNDDRGSVGSWDLGYAISCHKSQGSEWPWVVIMLDDYYGARRLCTRNWIYTAISRAKKGCLLIGPKSLADEMCCKDGLQRKTMLVERIKSCG